MVLQSGNQICNDAVVVEGMLEVNESLLTGESDAVVKEAGSELYSGSSVISGKAYAKVTHVGNENYATKLANEVKKEKRVASELLGSMNKVTRFTSMLIVPLGVILFFEAFLLRQAPMRDAVVSSAAALLGMLPKGLVLLISISLATGVIRLAKMKILVQNIYSLETLAHVDTLCLDKTGTITNGKLTVDTVMEIGAGLLGKALPQGEPEKLVQSYLAASDDNNATFQALKEAFGGQAFYTPAHKISFSSKRKWGCISFAQRQQRSSSKLRMKRRAFPQWKQTHRVCAAQSRSSVCFPTRFAPQPTLRKKKILSAERRAALSISASNWAKATSR